MANLNGRVTKMENEVTGVGTRPPGYVQAKDYAELEKKLDALGPGWRGKVYVGWGPDCWDEEADCGSEQTS